MANTIDSSEPGAASVDVVGRSCSGIADRRAPDRRSPGDAPDEIGRSEPARNLKTVA
jgi:hypothetical protein